MITSSNSSAKEERDTQSRYPDPRKTILHHQPQDQLWSWRSLFWKTAVQGAASIALNGQLYVFGGNNGIADVAIVQAYDPYKNKCGVPLR